MYRICIEKKTARKYAKILATVVTLWVVFIFQFVLSFYLLNLPKLCTLLLWNWKNIEMANVFFQFSKQCSNVRGSLERNGNKTSHNATTFTCNIEPSIKIVFIIFIILYFFKF